MKIYSNTQRESFFENCEPYEELRFQTLFEPAFRKKELVYLEKEDVLKDRQMLRVQSKTRYDENGNLLYKFKAKANSEREVPISKELMDRIVAHMNDPAHPNSRLVFCTSTGRPDTHLWDKIQTIAKRAAMDGFDLKTFRATRATEWLRPKWLGGCGYDVPTVRNLLGHDEESESIWSYVSSIEKEVLVAEMNKEEEQEKSTKTEPASLKAARSSSTTPALFSRRGLQSVRHKFLAKSQSAATAKRKCMASRGPVEEHAQDSRGRCALRRTEVTRQGTLARWRDLLHYEPECHAGIPLPWITRSGIDGTQGRLTGLQRASLESTKRRPSQSF